MSRPPCPPLAAAPLLHRYGPLRVWALAHTVMAAGVLAPVARPGVPAVVVAAVAVGGTFMVATLAAMRAARQAAPGKTRLVAAMTTAFAVGQPVGPLLVRGDDLATPACSPPRCYSGIRSVAIRPKPRSLMPPTNAAPLAASSCVDVPQSEDVAQELPGAVGVVRVDDGVRSDDHDSGSCGDREGRVWAMIHRPEATRNRGA